MSFRQKIGTSMEDKACSFLKQQGLRLVEKNYRCLLGEIDLIMHEQEQMVFVEVRFRKSKLYGDAAASISHHKQKKLMRTAKHYLVSNNKYDKIDCRFDVIAMHDNLIQPDIEWIRNAFQQ